MSNKNKLYRITWWAYNYAIDMWDDFDEIIKGYSQSNAMCKFKEKYPLARHIEIKELEDLELK